MNWNHAVFSINEPPNKSLVAAPEVNIRTTDEW